MVGHGHPCFVTSYKPGFLSSQAYWKSTRADDEAKSGYQASVHGSARLKITVRIDVQSKSGILDDKLIWGIQQVGGNSFNRGKRGGVTRCQHADQERYQKVAIPWH